MYKQARKLKRGDVWVDRIGCLWPVVDAMKSRLGNEEWVTITHKDGMSHTLKSDKTIEYI